MTPNTFTAAEIARASGSITRQGVAKLLLDTPATEIRVMRGKQETNAWSVDALKPSPLWPRLERDARRKGYRNPETMIAHDANAWQPPLPLRDLADDELNAAAKLRDVLTPFLHDLNQPGEERDPKIAARYAEAFGYAIAASYARKLFRRTLARDAGTHDFTRLDLFVSDHPKPKTAPEWTEDSSSLADLLPALESRLAGISTAANPPKAVVRSVWHVAFEEYTRLIAGGSSEDRAARLIREFLHTRAPFLPRNRDTLLKLWNEKLARWLVREGMPGALMDLRCQNGRKVEIPEADTALLRHSAMTNHSGRLDAAWREEYDQLSESTRRHYPKSWRVPRAVTRAVNRVILDGLVARRQGRRSLEKQLGTVLRNIESIPSMHAWVMDDLTCTLEVFARNPDGTTSLCLIQCILVMDVRSRKAIGWACSLDKGPTAELVCEAFLDAVRRTGKVPHHLFLENGWVFGRANNIVGKRDESDEVIIAGLAEYGCEVHHFTPAKPTAKGELEKSFDLLQRRMERLPGYTGREQRRDAPEQFRREQIEMRRRVNPRDPETCRYDFPQAIRAIEKIVNEYNETQNCGALKGMTPDAAFTAFEDHDNPPISLPHKLRWLLAYRYRVTVKLSGVSFSHFGEKLRVRGGALASLDRIGREFWAVVDRREADCVTFMSLDFSDVFTEPLRPVVDYDESETSPDSGNLQTEYETKAQMRRVIEDQYQGLMDRFGDPRKQLLQQAQEESRRLEAERQASAPARVPVLDPNYAAAGEEGKRQREELRKRRKQIPPKKSGPAARPGFEAATKSIFGSTPESTT